MPNLNEKLTNETIFNVENVNFNNTYEYGMLKELTDIKEYFIQQAKEAEKLHAEFLAFMRREKEFTLVNEEFYEIMEKVANWREQTSNKIYEIL